VTGISIARKIYRGWLDSVNNPRLTILKLFNNVEAHKIKNP